METNNAPMHISGLSIYDHSTAPPRITNVLGPQVPVYNTRARTVADPAFYRSCLQASFDELLSASTGRRKLKAKARARSKAKTRRKPKVTAR